MFRPNLRVVHVRNLNFILRSEIFMHSEGQLRASHLILGCNFVYTTWQPFRPALLVDSPLLSYIDVRHANFLSLSLTVSEARDLGPKYITTEDVAPVRDKSAERVSQSHKVDVPVEKLEAPVQVTELTSAESVHSSRVESDSGEENVTRRALTIDRFVPSA